MSAKRRTAEDGMADSESPLKKLHTDQKAAGGAAAAASGSSGVKTELKPGQKLTHETALALCQELYTQVTGESLSGSGGDADASKLRAMIDRALKDNALLREQSRDAKKRESELVIRLTQKEKDMYNLESSMKELHEESEARAMQLRTTYLDPLVNDAFTALQERVKDLEKKLRTATEDLKAVQFTPQTLTGRQLISKCRRLQDENEEFGRQLSDGRLQRLEADLTLQKMLTEELQQAVAESDDFVYQLDEELEHMESTIDLLRARERQREKEHAATTAAATATATAAAAGGTSAATDSSADGASAATGDSSSTAAAAAPAVAASA